MNARGHSRHGLALAAVIAVGVAGCKDKKRPPPSPAPVPVAALGWGVPIYRSMPKERGGSTGVGVSASLPSRCRTQRVQA